MIKEDKISLTHRRAELVTVLAGPLPTEDRVRIQGELSVINAKIKALNTTQHAQLKALADQRKAAGLAEAQANAARAQTRAHLLPQTKPLEDSDDARRSSLGDRCLDRRRATPPRHRIHPLQHRQDHVRLFPGLGTCARDALRRHRGPCPRTAAPRAAERGTQEAQEDSEVQEAISARTPVEKDPTSPNS